MNIDTLNEYKTLHSLQNSLNEIFDPLKAKELLELNFSLSGSAKSKKILKSHTVDFLIASLFENPNADKLIFISSHISTQEVAQFLFKSKTTPDNYQSHFDYYFDNFNDAQPHDLACLISRYICSSKNWIDFVLPQGNEIYFMPDKSFYFRANSKILIVEPDNLIEMEKFSLNNNDFPLMLYFLGVVGFTVENQLEFLSHFNPSSIKEGANQLNAEEILKALNTHLEKYDNSSFYTSSIIQASIVIFEKRVLEQKLYNIPTHSKLEKSDISNPMTEISNNSARVFKI